MTFQTIDGSCSIPQEIEIMIFSYSLSIGCENDQIRNTYEYRARFSHWKVLRNCKLVCKHWKSRVELIFDHSCRDNLPLHFSAKKGNTAEVSRLLGDHRVTSKDLSTALFVAIDRCHLDCIKLIAKNKRLTDFEV